MFSVSERKMEPSLFKSIFVSRLKTVEQIAWFEKLIFFNFLNSKVDYGLMGTIWFVRSHRVTNPLCLNARNSIV